MIIVKYTIVLSSLIPPLLLLVISISLLTLLLSMELLRAVWGQFSSDSSLFQLILLLKVYRPLPV